MQKARYVAALGIPLLAFLSFTLVAAWTGPTQAPPDGNVPAPINVGTTGQVKNGGLGVDTLTVFGNSLFGGSTGSNAYLNFGADLGEPGYGIRDKDGTLEFKNYGGSWQSIQDILWTLCGGSCGGGRDGGTTVAFSVNKGGTAQTVPANATTKLTWSNEVFDTNDNFANNRFTPTVAGKYIVTASLYCNSAATWCQIYIYKNGTNISSNFDRTSVDTSVSATIVVDMNGSTDYLEIYGRNGGSTSISGDTTLTNFSGALLSQQSGGSAPPASGTLCGMKDTARAELTTCMGYNPASSCPSGYTKKVMFMFQDNGANTHGIYSCVAN